MTKEEIQLKIDAANQEHQQLATQAQNDEQAWRQRLQAAQKRSAEINAEVLKLEGRLEQIADAENEE